MGLEERSPLMGGSDEGVPYVFMTNPKRAYNKKVRQLQCYLCTSILGVFLLALLVSVAYSVDKDESDDLTTDDTNDTLILQLNAPAQENFIQTDRSSSEDVIKSIRNLHLMKTFNENDTQTLPSPIKDPKMFYDFFNMYRCLDEKVIKYKCNETKYRTIDGVCNNFNYPLTWGVSHQELKRFFPPEYCDGLSSPKCSSSKSKLPPPHVVGLEIYDIVKGNMKDNNMITMLWGQFLYQDLFHLRFPGDEEPDCCSESKYRCSPLTIEKDDPAYSKYNTTCITYGPYNSARCQSGKRFQTNKATCFLDGSILYGNTPKQEKKVRLFQKGQLALYQTPENKYLPIDINVEQECEMSINKTKQCSNQGYSCISRDMGIPSINLMMARQHNLVASQLSVINPHWDDETIFQNARKIVSAQIQHITYNEFLEATIGIDSVKTFGDNSETGYFEEYNAEVDPSLSVEFVNTFQLLNSMLPENGNFLKENKESDACNLIKLTRRVHRGRDEGIAGYTKLHEACGLGKIQNFNGLSHILGVGPAKSLETIYESVEDIDLAIGMLGEKPDMGNRLGPVGTCILTEQFRRTKTGDRFWFESPQQPQAFTRDQLAEIHKTTLSRIICDHSKNITQVQYGSMKNTEDNPTLLCYTIPSLNLSLWDENLINPYSFVKIKESESGDFNIDQTVNVQKFMNSGNDYILQSSKANSNVTKKSTSFTVNILNATVKLENVVIEEIDSKKPPFTIPLDSVADQSSYTPSAHASFSATYEDDILQGMLSLPLKNTDTFQKAKKTLEINFIAGVSIKWGGSFTIDSKKSYDCKVMFQSYTKMSNSNSPLIKMETGETLLVRADNSGETCNIMLIGTYYHRPFYCSVTPWWCQDGLIFYWSGEAKLIFVKPNPMVQSISNLKSIQKPPNALGKTGNEVVEKTFASVTVINGKISGQFNGEDVITLLDGGPPIDISLDNFINPNSFDTSTTVTWSATTHNDRTILGEFSVPYFPTIGNSNINRRELRSNFSVDVIYKYGGSIGIIVPEKTYSCKVMFQGNKKLNLNDKTEIIDSISSSVKGKTPFGESCSITITGSFSEPSILCKLTPWWCNKEKIFHWSGDIELALKYKYSPSNEIKQMNTSPSEKNSISMDQNLKSVGINVKNLLEKSDNSVVEKTFASVTVIKGGVSGQFNGEEIITVMNGGPPIDIYLDGFVKPNSYETSVDATWTATPIDDRSVVGMFSIPYIPSIENYSDRRLFTANFSVDVIYKFGGSIGIIDPSKTYTCKVMFQANKKSSMNTKLLHSVSPGVPLKQKTPYGESCSITLSGSFPGPSIFCYLTPWWCSKENIFRWNGDIELAMKYKYNASDSDIKDNALKMLRQNKSYASKELDDSKRYPMQENNCCGHRFGGKVTSGWVETKTGGLFSTSKTIWSGEIPFVFRFPVFWAPSNDDESELSSVYGHAIIWSASIFHSTIQGSFSFPQYIGHGPPPSLKWINGKFLFHLEPNPFISLYDLIVPGIQYKSNLYFHNKNLANDTTFLTPKTREPTNEENGWGIRAPIILLGRYTLDKQFVWNGSFVIDLHKSAKDLYYG